MRILFAGSDSEISRIVFRGLAAEFPFLLLISRDNKPAGRGQKIHESSLVHIAEERGIPIFQPPKLDAEARDYITSYEPELLVCTAYGKILGPRFLSLFPRGAINVHPSLLPSHRGASPMQAAILNGDAETGVSIHYMVQEIDGGDIIEQEAITLHGTETFQELSKTLGECAVPLMARAIRSIQQQKEKGTRQEDAPYPVLHCSKISKEDGRIDWQFSARKIERMIRAYNSWPGVMAGFHDLHIKFHRAALLSQADYTAIVAAGRLRGEKHNIITDPNPSPGKILGYVKGLGILIATVEDVLVLKELQLPTRKVLDWKSFLSGVDNFIGTVLS